MMIDKKCRYLQPKWFCKLYGKKKLYPQKITLLNIRYNFSLTKYVLFNKMNIHILKTTCEHIKITNLPDLVNYLHMLYLVLII